MYCFLISFLLVIRKKITQKIISYAIFELFELHWHIVYKLKKGLFLDYYWWEVEYIKIGICATLERKWNKDFPGIRFVNKKFDEEDNELNPLYYKDSKLFMEKSLKIKKHLSKRII